jgi:hypothetical protein
MFRREMGWYERGLVGSFPGLGIKTVVACFQAGGKWWARMQLLKIAVRATMAIRGRFLYMGALSSSGLGAFLLFNSLMCASTSSGRTSTTRESSSGRRRRGWLGGVATEVVDASYHLREKSVVEVGVVGDLVDLFEGFGEAIRFFKGRVYDCVVPNEVVDSGGFLSCQSLELSPELPPVPVVEESTSVDPLLLTETVQVSSDLRIESVEDGF